MSDVGGMDGLVEAGVFYRCSDDGASGAGTGGAGDYIDVRSSDDQLKWKRGWQGDGEHLSFFRLDLDVG